MAESKLKEFDDFWLFHDVEDQEITELRKFIPFSSDGEMKYLEGITDIFEKIHKFFK